MISRRDLLKGSMAGAAAMFAARAEAAGILLLGRTPVEWTPVVTNPNNTIFINDFYPVNQGPIGASQTPTSLGYANMAAYIAALPAAYQAYVPAAATTSDQIDWIAWQTAMEFGYSVRAATLLFQDPNLVAALIRCNGPYVINKTITISFFSQRIMGNGCCWDNKLHKTETYIQLIGAGGTIDDPQYIFDFYGMDSFLDPPAGKADLGVGQRVDVEDIKFAGNFGDLGSINQNVSQYKSGILMRWLKFMRIRNCVFTGCLYDGIVIRDPSLFLVLYRNLFDGCHRDGHAIWSWSGNFTTTNWYSENTFRNCGRYALYSSHTGGVEPMPIIQDNIIESGIANSYYVLHPDWFHHSVVAPVCVLNGTNGIISGNQFKVTGYVAGFWADLHLPDTSFILVEDSNLKHIFLSLVPSTGGSRTTDGVSWQKPYGPNKSLDLTNNRNWRSAVTGNVGSASVASLTLRNLPNLGKILLGGDIAVLSGGTNHTFEGVDFDYWVVNVVDGPATTAVNPVAWQASTTYFTNLHAGMPTVVQPTTPNGFFYQAVNGDGVSAGTEPASWPTTLNAEITDGTVTWRNIGSTSSFSTSRKVVAQPAVATPAISRIGGNRHVLMNSRFGTVRHGFFGFGVTYGDTVALDAASMGYPVWQATHAYTNVLDANLAPTDMIVVPPTHNGFYYQCVGPGTSGASAPSFSTTIDATFADGGVTWKCVGVIAHEDYDGVPFFSELGSNLNVIGAANPTVGRWTAGNKIWDPAPVAGGNVGRVCTTAGLVGSGAVFKPFGPIAA